MTAVANHPGIPQAWMIVWMPHHSWTTWNRYCYVFCTTNLPSVQIYRKQRIFLQYSLDRHNSSHLCRFQHQIVWRMRVSSNQSTIIMAKNRVAPVKPLTVPKLELCAALLGARFSRHITSAIECKKVYLWSDSQIVLNWISSTKHQPIFISNHVKEIRELTGVSNGIIVPQMPTPPTFYWEDLLIRNFETTYCRWMSYLPCSWDNSPKRLQSQHRLQ